MYLLLALHFLQFIFLRHFYDEERRVNTNHWWVWCIHFMVYPYVFVCYVKDL
jgi:hypothetical protein